MAMWRIALVIFAGCLGAMGQTNVSSLRVTPTTLNFTAIDPDTGGPAAQSSTADIRLSQSGIGRPWSLSVRSEADVLTNCGSIPASALVVRCLSATIDAPQGQPTATCNSSPIPVSTTQVNLATGNQGRPWTRVTVNFQVSFADSWRYQAALAPACTVSLIYTVDAP